MVERSRLSIKTTDTARFKVGRIYGKPELAYFFKVTDRTEKSLSGVLFDWKGNIIQTYRKKKIEYLDAWVKPTGWAKTGIEFISCAKVDGGFDAFTEDCGVTLKKLGIHALKYTI